MHLTVEFTALGGESTARDPLPNLGTGELDFEFPGQLVHDLPAVEVTGQVGVFYVGTEFRGTKLSHVRMATWPR